jgi:hypothetical protein
MILWQLGRVLRKWLTALCFEGRPVYVPVLIKKKKTSFFFFSDEMKIIGKSTFSDGWLRSNKKIACKKFGQCVYCLIKQNIWSFGTCLVLSLLD